MLDLYENEVAVDGGEGGAPEPAATEPVQGDPGDEHVEPAAPAAPEFDPDAFQADTIAQVQALLENYQQPSQQIPGATPGSMSGQFDWGQIDPYGEDFGSQLGNGIRAEIHDALQSAFTPLAQSIEQDQQERILAQGEENIKDMIADERARNGDYGVNDEANSIAEQMIRERIDLLTPHYVNRYGQHPRAVEAAAEHAAKDVRALIKAASQAGATQQANHVATLAGAQGEPATSGAAAVVQGDSNKYPDRYAIQQELVKKYATG